MHAAAAVAARSKKHKVVRKGKKKKGPLKPAGPPKPAASGPAASISLAKQYLEVGNSSAALEQANLAIAKVPQLVDYAQYYRAQAEYQLKNDAEAIKAVTQVFSQQLISPLTGPAAAVGVSAYLDQGNPKQAFDLVKKYFDKIPQPQGTLLLARCLVANNDLPQAAEYYQRVYYNYPNSREAADAATALADLKTKLADGFPPVMPGAMLGRAEKLLEAHRTADAKSELYAAVPQLTGVQRDQARVRVAAPGEVVPDTLYWSGGTLIPATRDFAGSGAGIRRGRKMMRRRTCRCTGLVRRALRRMIGRLGVRGGMRLMRFMPMRRMPGTCC